MRDMTQEEIDEARRLLKLSKERVEDSAIIALAHDSFLLQRVRLRAAFAAVIAALAGPTEPIMFPQANGTLHGNNDTKDLPVCRTAEKNICSCWHIPLWKRIKLLWTGNVYLVVKGTTHPPLWIDTEIFWK